MFLFTLFSSMSQSLSQSALSTTASTEENRFLFVASIDNARNVSTLLKAVHFREASILLLKYVSNF